MMNQGTRSYGGSGRSLQQQLPSIRSMSNQGGVRQTHYNLPSGNTQEMAAFGGSPPRGSHDVPTTAATASIQTTSNLIGPRGAHGR